MMSRSLLPFSLSGMGSSSLASSSLRCEEAEGVPPSSRPPWPGCGQLTGAPSSPRLDPLSLDVDDADEGTVVELTATLDISSVCFSCGQTWPRSGRAPRPRSGLPGRFWSSR
ncbi:unnamed protein product, partial [Ixodes pacificus]